MLAATTTHIYLDERGVARSDDTNGKLIKFVLDKFTHGSSLEQTIFSIPAFLKQGFMLRFRIIMIGRLSLTRQFRNRSQRS